MTGTEECLARFAMSEWGPTRATMALTMLEITTEVSYSDSFTPSCISSFPRNIGCPPIATTALSVETRVRVERFENSIATDLLESPFRKGHVEGSLVCLWAVALLTSVANSVGVRSDIERRCRGEVVVERDRVCWRGRKSARREAILTLSIEKQDLCKRMYLSVLVLLWKSVCIDFRVTEKPGPLPRITTIEEALR
jgi:hypothetical protein